MAKTAKEDGLHRESAASALPSWLTLDTGIRAKREGNSLLLWNDDFPECTMRMALKESPRDAQHAYTAQFQHFQETLGRYRQKLEYLSQRYGFEIRRTHDRCDITQVDYHLAYQLSIPSSDSPENMLDALTQLEAQAKEVDDTRFEQLLVLEESGFTLESVESAGKMGYQITGGALKQPLFIPEHIDAKSLTTIDILLGLTGLEQVLTEDGAEEKHIPASASSQRDVPIQQKVSLILDAPIFRELASSRGKGRSWVDLLPLIAVSPTVEKIYIPAQVADWELRGQVTHYEPDGSLGVTQIDSEFLSLSHPKGRSWRQYNALLSSADRWQLDDDGVGHLIPGKNHNIIIYETELDRKTMDMAKKIHEDKTLSFSEKRTRYQILRTDKGEKAMEAIAGELDHDCPAYMVTNDFKYLGSRLPITTRRHYPVGEATSIGLLGAVLNTQGDEIKAQLEAAYGPMSKLSLEQITQDFLKGGTYDTFSYPDWYAPCTPGNYRANGTQQHGETLTDIFARGAAILRDQPISFVIPSPNDYSPENLTSAPTGNETKRFVRGLTQTPDNASAENFKKRQPRGKGKKAADPQPEIPGLRPGNWKLLRRVPTDTKKQNEAPSIAPAAHASPLFSTKELNALRRQMNALLDAMTPGDIAYQANQRTPNSIDPLTISRILGHAQMHLLDQSTLDAYRAPLAALVDAMHPGTHQREAFEQLYTQFSMQLLALKEESKTADYPELPEDREYWPSATILKGCTAVNIDTRMLKVEQLREACAELLKEPDRLLAVPADEAHGKPAGTFPVKELLGQYKHKIPLGYQQALEGFFYFFDPRIKEHLREKMSLTTWLPQNRQHWPSATMKGCTQIGVERTRANADAIERICQRLLNDPTNAWELGNGPTAEETAGLIPVSDLIKFHSNRGQSAAYYFDPRLLHAGVITKEMINEERRESLAGNQKEAHKQRGDWSKINLAKFIHVEYQDTHYQQLWESIAAAYYANDDHSVAIDGHNVKCAEKTAPNGRQMLFIDKSEAEWVKFKLGKESAYDPHTDQTKWQEKVQKKPKKSSAERKSILPDSPHIQNRTGMNRTKDVGDE